MRLPLAASLVRVVSASPGRRVGARAHRARRVLHSSVASPRFVRWAHAPCPLDVARRVPAHVGEAAWSMRAAVAWWVAGRLEARRTAPQSASTTHPAFGARPLRHPLRHTPTITMATRPLTSTTWKAEEVHVATAMAAAMATASRRSTASLIGLPVGCRMSLAGRLPRSNRSRARRRVTTPTTTIGRVATITAAITAEAAPSVMDRTTGARTTGRWRRGGHLHRCTGARAVSSEAAAAL